MSYAVVDGGNTIVRNFGGFPPRKVILKDEEMLTYEGYLDSCAHLLPPEISVKIGLADGYACRLPNTHGFRIRVWGKNLVDVERVRLRLHRALGSVNLTPQFPALPLLSTRWKRLMCLIRYIWTGKLPKV